MKIKCFVLLLAVLLAMSMFGTVAMADDPEGPFTYNMSWLYLTGYTGTDTELVLPATFVNPNSGVEWNLAAIAECAFQYNETLTSVSIPEGYAAIHPSAFMGCFSMSSVALPDTLIAVDDKAFMDCTALEEITFGPALSVIGNSAFCGDSALVSVTFTGSVPCIEKDAFIGVSEDLVFYVPDDLVNEYAKELKHAMPGAELDIRESGSVCIAWDHTTDENLFEFDAETGTITRYLGYLGRVDVPDTISGIPVTAIGCRAFNYRYDDGYMYYLTIPEGVTVIEDGAVNGADRLVWVNFPSTLKTIGKEAFKSFGGERAILNEGLEVIGEAAFRFSGLTLNEVCIPDSVRVIGDAAFEGASLTEIKLPRSLEIIGENAFHNVSATGSLKIPKGAKTIGAGAFANTKFEMISVPASVEIIGEKAFAGCIKLQKLVFAGESLPEIAVDAFADAWPLVGKTGKATNVFIPQTAEANMASVQAWFDDNGYTAEVMLSEAEGVVAVPADDFEQIKDGNELLLGAYKGSEEMIEAPASGADGKFTSVAEGAFANDMTIKYFALPKDGKYSTIGANAFAGSSVEEVSLPEGIKNIYDGAFENCAELRSITIPASVIYVGDNAFKGCTALEEVVFAEGSTLIALPDGMFEGCISLKNVKLPENLQTMRKTVFKDCKALTGIELPAQLGTISDSAFENSGLITVTLPGSVTSLGTGAFKGCTSLTSIDIPVTVNTVGRSAFEDCTSLTEAHLACKNMNAAAFKNCSSLQVLTMEILPTALSSDVFEGTALTYAVLPVTPESDLRFVPEDAMDAIRLPASATDEEVAAMAEKLGRGKRNPMLRDGEEASVIKMTEQPTDASVFEFDAETGRITGYFGDDIDVVVPAYIDGVQVRVIGYTAFDCCRDYTDTDIINNIKKWVRLRSVVLPETVEVIEDGAFEYCQQLQRFICYAPLDSTGKRTFNLCRKLHTVRFVNGVTLLDNYLFQGCDCLTDMYFGEDVEKIGTEVYSFSNVRSVYLNAKQVDARAVRECPMLEELHIGASVDTLAEAPMVQNCPSLKTIYIEGDSAAFIPNDGLVAVPAQSVTVYVNEGIPQEERERIQKHLSMWSMMPPIVKVQQVVCEFTHETPGELRELLPDVEPTECLTAEPTEAPTTDPTWTLVSIEGAEELLGVWYLQKIAFGDVEMSAADVGMVMTLTLNADGTMAMEADGDAEEGTWTFDGNGGMLTSGGAPAAFTYDGTALTASDDDTVMVFTREMSEPSFVAPETIAAESAEDFNGVWTAQKADAYGMLLPSETILEEMGEALGMENLSITVKNGSVSLFGKEATDFEFANGELVKHGGAVLCLCEDGTLRVEIMGMNFYCDAEVSTAPETPETTEAPESDGSPDLSTYMGTWYGIYLKAGINEGNPQEMWGLLMTLTLNEDGTGVLDYAGPDEGMHWYYDAERDTVFYGENTGDSADTPLSFTDEGYLLYGTAMSGYTIFSHEKRDTATILPTYEAQNTEIDPAVLGTAAPSATTVVTGDMNARTEIKYACVSAISAGMVLDPSVLGGEYSVVFHENGSTDLTIAGVTVPGLAWTENADGLVEINYYGTILTFTPTETGFELDYFGAMVLKMEPEA